jgi:hypothetical protein
MDGKGKTDHCDVRDGRIMIFESLIETTKCHIVSTKAFGARRCGAFAIHVHCGRGGLSG